MAIRTEILLENKAHIASLDVDAQNTFTPVCPDELPVPNAEEIVTALNAQAEFARYRIGSKDAHSPKALWIADDKHPVFSTIDADNMDMHWPSHAIVGSLGFELIKGLPPVTAYDYFVWKGIEIDMHPYGVCYHDFAEKMSTGLIEFLRQKAVTTVLVGGLATDYCVKSTVLQLLNANFKVIVNHSACRAITAETEQQAIAEMTAKGALFIDSVAALQPNPNEGIK